jgi:Carbohydrate-binding family 9
MKNYSYRIQPTGTIPEMRGYWAGPVWRKAECVSVDCFRPEGSDHRPETLSKLLYDNQYIFGIFRVEDRFVRCIHAGFQQDVWKDSCVEMFIQPKDSPGYFNFEFNCGGALQASYVIDPTRLGGRLKNFIPLTPQEDRRIRRFASQPQVVEPEISQPLTWYLEYAIPFTLLEKYAGPLGNVPGQIWRANFYKCGNETSHPHWASWMPIAERNFHDPAGFGELIFNPF